MKVSELEGAELDYWVAKAELGEPNKVTFNSPEYQKWSKDKLIGYHPSTDWSQGGPIIEREGIDVVCGFYQMVLDDGHKSRYWSAMINTKRLGDGPTPLIAAMRAYVIFKFGETFASI